MIVILMGVSGSGKTAVGKKLAEETSLPFYDADDFHTKENKEKMHAGIPLTDSDRLPWLTQLADLIRRHIELGESMILACSALKASYRKILKVDPSCEFVYLKGSYELIQKQLQKRKGHFFNPDLLKSQFQDLEEPEGAIAVDAALSIHKITQTIIQRLKL